MRKALFSLALALAAYMPLSAQNYCVSGGPSSSFDSDITDLYLIGDSYNISHLNSCPGFIGVENLTNLDSADVSLGNTYSVVVTHSSCNGFYGGAGQAWIDWNQNGTFETTESIGQISFNSGQLPLVHQYTFTVPANALLGSTRLRVMHEEGGALPLNPCGSFSWGSVEDHNIVVNATAPSCPQVSGLSVTNLTSAGATVSWTTSSGNVFNIEYGVSGFTQGSGTLVTGITGTSTVLATLAANTTYDFYVQNNCTASGNGTSGWSIPVSFTTLCTVFSSPYTENFDSSSWIPQSGFPPVDGIDQCWDRTPSGTGWAYKWLVGTGMTPSFATGPSGDHTSGTGKYVYTEASNGSPGDTAEIISPAVNLTGLTAPSVSFWYHMFGTEIDEMTVSISTNGGTTWTALGTLSGSYQNSETDPWQELLVDLSAYANQTVRIKWSAASLGCCAGDIAIDDVSFDNAPPCLNPAFLSVYNVTDSTATVYFNSNGTNFNFEWGPDGFTQGTGTQGVATNDTIVLTGLSGNTSYDFYVQNDCGINGFSAWIGPLSFTTPCSPFSATYSEYFDATGLVSFDPMYCWDVITLGSSGFGNAYQEVYAPQVWDQLQAASAPMVLHYSTANATWSALQTPFFSDLTSNANQLRFKAGVTWSTMTVYVGTMVGSDTSTFVAVDTISPAQNTWTDYLIYLNNVPANHNRVAFVNGGGGFWSDLYIDNFNYEPIPSCIPPSALTASNITQTSMDFSWVAGGATEWAIEYGPTGFVQGTGSVDTANVNTGFTLSGLTIATCYDFYIQGICSPTDQSPWAGPFTFCTDICSNPCLYTIVMDDSWGGTWWNSSVDVIIGNGITFNFQHTTWGSPSTATFPVCDGMPLQVVFNTAFPGGSELFTIYDANGTLVTSQPSPTIDGVVYTGMGFCPTCIPPQNLGANSLGMTSGNLTWTSVNGAPSNIEWGPQGFVQGTGTGTVVHNVNSGYLLTGLDTGTCYDFYVQDSCAANDLSYWSGPFTFCTSVCEVVNQCSFDVHMFDTFGDGWNNAEFAFEINGVPMGTVGAGFTNGTNFLDSIALCDGDTVDVICVDAGIFPGEVGFNLLASWGDTLFTWNPSWSLSSGAMVGSFYATCTPPTCPNPTQLSASAITQTSATLSWTMGANSAGSVVEYGPQGFMPGSGTTATSTTGSLAVAGLMSATCYEFYVMDSCGVNDLSGLVGPYQFCTQACDPQDRCAFTVNMTDTWGDGWNGATIVFTQGANVDTAGTTFTTGTSATETVYLCGGDSVAIYVLDAGFFPTECGFTVEDSAGNVLVTWLPSFTFANGAFVGGFIANCAGVANCSEPTGLAATNITCNSASINWNQLGDGSVISYGPVGFTPGMGTQATATPPYSLTGLTATTSYHVYVQDTCNGIGTSNWVGPITVATTGNNVVADATGSMTGSTAASMTFGLDASGSSNATSYSWDFGNGLTGTGVNPSVTYTTNGTYSVVLTATGPCGTDTDTIDVFVNISAEELSGLSGLSMYPNPTTDVVRVDFNTTERLNVTVTLLNSVGQVIQSSEYANVMGNHQSMVDLSNMPKGVYLLQVRTSKGAVTRRISLQ